MDLFAGGGGASTGIEAALGRSVDIAINHSPVALAVHDANHPGTRHLTADIWEVKPKEATGGRHVDLLWASPDCTHFSVAKGGKPRKQNIRSLAWAVCRWAADVRPDVIALENVAEFKGWGPLDKDGKPIKTKMGQTFLRWKRRLENLGYVVDFRILDASHFGAPTRRRRLFLVARCDGQRIVWPRPTHGPGLKPFRTAAECIDWSLPCPSIFERKKPLAEKTLWRIAQGIKRFVIENPKPFIVKFQENSIGQPITQPLDTVMAGAPRFGLVSPSIVEMNHSNAPHGAHEPLGVVTTQGNRFNLVTPIVAGVGGRAGQSEATPGDAPVGTITAKNDRVVVAPYMVEYHSERKGEQARLADLDSPIPVQTTENRFGLVAPTLIQTGYGEREGQAARTPEITKPLGTVVAGGQKHAAVAAFLSKAYGEQPGKWVGASSQGLDQQMPTVTTQDHNNLAAVTLATFRGTHPSQPGSASIEDPLPVISAGGTHVAEVYAFLLKYYGTDQAPRLDGPLGTVTTRDRFGLVTVEGIDYEIVDIGMRMLEPHELLAAQFGRFAPAYDLSRAKTKAAKVRLIGNSVAPEVAEAVIRANFEAAEEMAA